MSDKKTRKKPCAQPDRNGGPPATTREDTAGTATKPNSLRPTPETAGASDRSAVRRQGGAAPLGGA